MQVVEVDGYLPPGKYGNRHKVATDAKAANKEGGCQGEVRKPGENCHPGILQ